MGHTNVFTHLVNSEEELRDLLGHPGKLAANKTIRILDDHCRNYIAKSSFLVIATSDVQGNCDASPRGDAPGFVKVLDDKHLVIPERQGNRKFDSLLNLLANPNLGLFFLIPGLGETLRINGRGYVIRDQAILEGMAVQGKVPLVGIGVEVEECYIHCAKALKRSGLWQPSTWLSEDQLPSIPNMLAAHIQLPDERVTPEEIAKSLHESYTKRLY
ncbi:MSMEG_1061 family FMN-dependent PPOX-type flavoprotein [Paenibacillus sedimenti]|uniref:Pyridoxamine 5'-phosphate oxidase family protein n=1 Tax=Paenibacillus sedimenti TaxID=2770274 RepID=A0A926QL07_9BACL|nr:MSMEG_1061 family FMN-dependent PPOX-type flavoprotein [Paenibacillus sedimenti]MBD0383095.1 pyridoxamine 5'-phosphate oxidase family protein [Paenibacillus sedimenti]